MCERGAGSSCPAELGSSSFDASVPLPVRVLRSNVPRGDFALGLGVERCAANMRHFLTFQPLGQTAGDVARTVVAEQAWLVTHNRLVATRRRQRQFDRICHILRSHVCAKLPRNDVATVIIQDRAQIIPAPADDLEVGKVGLPLARQGMFTCPRGASG